VAHRPRKRFGQHFLIDPGVIGAIVSSIGASSADVVVEIGPGQGAITNLLAAGAGTLHTVELDRDLAARLRVQYEGSANVVIHEADALKFDFGSLGDKLRVVGNLPYNISTPLLFHLLNYRERIRDMHFMLQKEVVDRMAAPPGSKAYGRLSIMLGCHFQIDALFDVDRLAFDPPPEVTSAVVRLAPLPFDTYQITNETHLSRLVAAAFSQRRKTIRNSLRKHADEQDLSAVGIDPGSRPETVAISAYVDLSNRLFERENSAPD
jgi:16S rRNA (adenine1518-N6/adenine1519-N6)-dimethyltransferase